MLHLSSWHLVLKALACILLYRYMYSYEERQVYIVFVEEQPDLAEGREATELHHKSVVEKVLGSKFAPQHLLHSYKNFDGFVVRLTEKEATKMREADGVVSVLASENHEMLTTRSWNFLGFPENVKRDESESDIIVGVIDSGIWPQSPSFDDRGFGPKPAKWRGSCEKGFPCNKKIIGAQYFHLDSQRKYGPDDDISPKDTNGHGSHCASVAAGNAISASLDELAKGTARGGVPSARIAVYKVCWSDGCFSEDILEAFDEAIDDGVDIISVSLNSKKVKEYDEDIFAIGAFRAMRKKGIFTSKGAGNEAIKYSSMYNYAPWYISVAATSIDRRFLTNLQLGNTKGYTGMSVNTFDLQKKMYPLIYAGDVPNTKAGFDGSVSRYCEKKNCLDANRVKGKIIVCDGFGDKEELFRSGAAGVIIQSSLPLTFPAYIYPLPAIAITEKDGKEVLDYIKSAKGGATATIFKSTAVGDQFSPFISYFSSRGPNVITPDILKPDIAAPGVNILAAWSPENSISEVKGDQRLEKYNVLSGTSVATPHVAAIAAYVKSFHPDWSPSAIKSALMTTATRVNSELSTGAEFAYGAGQLNPKQAVNPGLVYDISVTDYMKFLCGQPGYDTKRLQKITRDSSRCSDVGSKTAKNLNLPSFAYKRDASGSINQEFNRIVTNVGEAKSTYKATVTVPSSSPSLSIQVQPNVLEFKSVKETKSFKVTIKGSTKEEIVSASLVWDNGKVQVRSPIVVYRLK